MVGEYFFAFGDKVVTPEERPCLTRTYKGRFQAFRDCSLLYGPRKVRGIVFNILLLTPKTTVARSQL